MIIDITREMDNNEYKAHLDLLERYHKKYDYIQWHELNFSSEYDDYEDPDKKMLDITTKEEDDNLEDLDVRASICAGDFKYQRQWYVEDDLLDYNILLWLRKEKITDYFLIREIIYDRFWLCFKHKNDHKLFQAKWKYRFDSSFLMENGWFKQKMGPDEQVKWAQEYLENDFLYDYKTDNGYFRNGTEAALKLRWT